MTPSTADMKIREEAADWFARLQGDADVATWEAFRDWLEADPAHADAYTAVELLWLDLDEAGPAPETPADTVVAFKPRPARPRLWIAGAMAAAAAAVTAVLVTPAMFAPRPVDYQTAKGETRAMVLADGSRLVLAPSTHLRVRLTKKERDVELLDGETSFDVAHEAQRPFVVALGGREVRVLGTEFNILRQTGRLAVTVRRGLVAVADPKGGATYRVAKGQQLLAAGDGPPTVRSVDPNPAFAWTNGRLVYDQTPLPQVAADLNRYLPTPIRVAPDATGILVSGVLLVDREEAIIERLQLFTPVTAQTVGGEIVLKAKATPR